MRVVIAALVALILTTASYAEAQVPPPSHKPSSVYVFEGFSYARVQGELAARVSEVAPKLQIGLGYQPANSLWAYELMGRGGGTVGAYDTHAGLLGWGIRAKRIHPLGRHFHLYGRVGATENLLTDAANTDLVGFGVEYGVGAMASFRVRALGFLFWPAFFLKYGPKVNVGVWADLGGEMGNMHSGHERSAESYNYRTAASSFGVNVGGRF